MVLSDTHKRITAPLALLRRDRTITHILHLGDHADDAGELHKHCPGRLLFSVRGNCDMLCRAPEELLLNLCGWRIFAAHGHRYGVKSGLSHIASHAKGLGCNLVLFGHTHRRTDETVCGVRCLNPSANGYIIITQESIVFSDYE